MSAPERTGLSPTTLHAMADVLMLAEIGRKPIAPLSAAYPDLTVADAYEIQAINARSRVQSATSPAPIVGHKIGLTSKAMQEMLGVDEPDYGVLYEDRVFWSGAVIDTSELIAPRIEPEIAFVLVRDLSGPGVTAADVLAATEAVVPSLEVIDSRIADWKITLVDTIADNASCARVVLGTRGTVPANGGLAEATVDLRIDGQTVQRGKGADVLGHPAEAVAWLANALARHGVTLRARHIVMPGSLTAAVPLTAGSTVTADFGALGTVEVKVR